MRFAVVACACAVLIALLTVQSASAAVCNPFLGATITRTGYSNTKNFAVGRGSRHAVGCSTSFWRNMFSVSFTDGAIAFLNAPGDRPFYCDEVYPAASTYMFRTTSGALRYYKDPGQLYGNYATLASANVGKAAYDFERGHFVAFVSNELSWSPHVLGEEGTLVWTSANQTVSDGAVAPMEVHDGRAYYVADGSLHLVDYESGTVVSSTAVGVSDPPAYLRRFGTVVGVSYASNYMQLWDVSNANAPALLSTVAASTTDNIGGFEMYNTETLLVTTTNVIDVFDVSDLSNPTLFHNETSQVKLNRIYHDNGYIMLSTSYKISIMEVVNPACTSTMKTVQQVHNPTCAPPLSGSAFMASGYTGAFDMSPSQEVMGWGNTHVENSFKRYGYNETTGDKTGASYSVSYNIPITKSVVGYNTDSFLVTNNGGNVIAVPDINSPVAVAVSLSGTLYGWDSAGDYFYGARTSDSVMCFKYIDWSSEPTVLMQLSTGAAIADMDVLDNVMFALHSGDLQAFIVDPSNCLLTPLSTFPFASAGPAIAGQSVRCYNHYMHPVCVVATGLDGFRIIDVSNPSAMTEVSRVGTYGRQNAPYTTEDAMMMGHSTVIQIMGTQYAVVDVSDLANPIVTDIVYSYESDLSSDVYKDSYVGEHGWYAGYKTGSMFFPFDAAQKTAGCNVMSYAISEVPLSCDFMQQTQSVPQVASPVKRVWPFDNNPRYYGVTYPGWNAGAKFFRIEDDGTATQVSPTQGDLGYHIIPVGDWSALYFNCYNVRYLANITTSGFSTIVTGLPSTNGDSGFYDAAEQRVYVVRSSAIVSFVFTGNTLAYSAGDLVSTAFSGPGVGLMHNGNAYVASGSRLQSFAPNGSGGLVLVDEATYPTSGTIRTAKLFERNGRSYLLIAAGAAGTYIYDITEPTMSRTATLPLMWGTTANDAEYLNGFTIVVSEPSGFSFFDVSDLAAPRASHNYMNGHALSIAPGYMTRRVGHMVVVSDESIGRAYTFAVSNSSEVCDMPDEGPEPSDSSSSSTLSAGSASSSSSTSSSSMGVSGDPHFHGFRGQRFDFHGVPFNTYNLLTTRDMNLNAYFVPGDRYDEGVTYVGALTIADAAGNQVHVDCANHELAISFNGDVVEFDHNEWSAPEVGVMATISRRQRQLTLFHELVEIDLSAHHSHVQDNCFMNIGFSVSKELVAIASAHGADGILGLTIDNEDQPVIFDSDYQLTDSSPTSFPKNLLKEAVADRRLMTAPGAFVGVQRASVDTGIVLQLE